MKGISWIFGGIAVFIVLEVVTVILGVATEMTYLESFRVIFGSVYVLFVPGLVWSFVFFPFGEKKVDIIERIALSFALSIAIVPLAVFYLNLIGLKISAWSSFLVVLVLIIAGLSVVILRRKRRVFE
ncbi:DUF1616 domain-containing protein [Candidatus Pacearchaeota archaeon]|nr:DUF1616 domain-containing protein [Candidatus Pacearchaeota archaeon]